MDHQNCILCNNNTRNENNSKESEFEFNISKGDPLKSHLKIVFFVRKILEIPQNICCTFLEEYGDPNSWMGCCDSCSVLIEDGKHIFDQIIMLQKQFKALQNQIKRQIIGTQMERKFGEGQGRVEEIIQSYVCKENTSVKEENTAEHLTYSGVDVHESSFCLHDIDTFVVNNDVPDDVYPPGVAITEGDDGNHFFEDSDPLRLDKNAEVKDFELENINGAHNVEFILPKSEPAFHSETSDTNLSSIFNDDSETANYNKPANKTDEHLENNFNLKLYNQCETCGKLCTSGSDLVIHQRTHTEEKPYECLIFDIVDNSSFTHLMTMNTRDISDSSHLPSHTRSQSGEKPFKCNICGKSFSESTHLTRHKRLHTGEKPFKCDVCGKCFTNSTCLTRHARSHSGEKPFKCNVCAKSCTQSSDLTRHKSLHTGEKRFKCDICGKCFFQLYRLNVHTRSHSGEKPFKCNFCGKSFTEPSVLTRHKKIHIAEKHL